MRKPMGIFLCVLLCLALLLSGCSVLPDPQRKLSELFPNPSDSPQPTASAQPEEAEPPALPDDGIFRYCRSLLPEAEQKCYDQLAAGLMNMDSKITFVSLDKEVLNRLITYVLSDYPELFWADGSGTIRTRQSAGFDVSISFLPDYSLSPQEAAEAREQIDRTVNGFLETLPSDASDYQRAMAVYRYIIDLAEYDEGLDTNSIYNIFVSHKGICGCYSKATQYLLGRLGIRSVTVSGTADSGQGSGPHAWNLVWLNGDSYWMDVTWGDPLFAGGDGVDLISYDYFCVTDGELFMTHSPNYDFPLPACTATECNYFVANGLYFDGYDKARIRKLLEYALNNGLESVSIKLTGDEAYEQTIDALFSQGGYFEMLDELAALGYSVSHNGSVYYSYSQAARTITLVLP